MSYMVTAKWEANNYDVKNENDEPVAVYKEYCLDGIAMEEHKDIIGNARTYEELPEDFNVEMCEEVPIGDIAFVKAEYGDLYFNIDLPPQMLLSEEDTCIFVNRFTCVEEIEEQFFNYFEQIIEENEIKGVFIYLDGLEMEDQKELALKLRFRGFKLEKTPHNRFLTKIL